MARVPKSLITVNIPSKDGEFVYTESGLPYSGNYHIISGVAYAGGDQSSFNPPVSLDQVSKSQFASLISSTGYATAAYAMAKQNFEIIKQTSEKFIQSLPIQRSGESQLQRSGKYTFTQKLNDPNNIIKEIKNNSSNSEILLSLQKDPLYKLVEIDFSSPNSPQQIESGEKIISGLKTFVNL
jgi:uncharacterized protein (UPF0333 family)